MTKIETGITEGGAARILRLVIRQGIAKEFMERVCFGNDFYTLDPDGTIVILDGELLEGLT